MAALWTSVFVKVLTRVHIEHATCPWDTVIHSTGQEILCHFGIGKFITLFLRYHNCTLLWVTLIQFIHQFFSSLISILLLSSHLCLYLPTCLFPSGFLSEIVYAFNDFKMIIFWLGTVMYSSNESCIFVLLPPQVNLVIMCNSVFLFICKLLEFLPIKLTSTM